MSIIWTSRIICALNATKQNKAKFKKSRQQKVGITFLRTDLKLTQENRLKIEFCILKTLYQKYFGHINKIKKV
jgi:hypothetical protein